MNKLKISALIAALSLAAVLQTPAPGNAKTIQPPAVDMNEAIAIAEKYIRTHGVDISRHMLASVKYMNMYHDYEKPYWRFEWSPLFTSKGSQIYILVYPDGAVSMLAAKDE